MNIGYVVFEGDTFIKGGFTQDYDLEKQAGPGETAYAVPSEVLTFPDLTLAPLRDKLRGDIDSAAETRRLDFITSGAGQAMTYQHKADEARAVLADSSAATPFLTAESEATGQSVADIAAAVVAQVNAWISAGSKIEAARIKAKAAVNAASDVPSLFAAATVDWSAITA